MRKIMFALAPFVWVSAGFADVSAYVPKASGDSDISFADACAAVLPAFAAPGKIEIYEGWPRVIVSAKNILAGQPQDAPPLIIDGESFYPQLQVPAVDDAQALRRLMGLKLLRPWRGLKLCGGFHPDFAVRFESEGSSYSILFCLTCHEARLVRAPSASESKESKPDFRLTADLAPELFNELKTLLLKYRKHNSVRS